MLLSVISIFDKHDESLNRIIILKSLGGTMRNWIENEGVVIALIKGELSIINTPVANIKLGIEEVISKMVNINLCF